MNDYLWDKKGEDKAVSDLESKLSVFASNPLSEVTDTEDSSVSIYKGLLGYWKLAPVFASALFAVTFLGFQFTEEEFDHHSLSLVTEPIVAEEPMPAVSKPVVPRLVESVSTQGKATTKVRYLRKPSKARKAVRKPYRFKRLKKANPLKAQREKAIEITPEERAAYEQLRKALAITSSNLSILKEKIEGDSNNESLESKE